MFLFIFYFLAQNLGDPKISQLVLYFLVIFLNSSKPTFPLKRYLSGNIDDGYSV